MKLAEKVVWRRWWRGGSGSGGYGRVILMMFHCLGICFITNSRGRGGGSVGGGGGAGGVGGVGHVIVAGTTQMLGDRLFLCFEYDSLIKRKLVTDRWSDTRTNSRTNVLSRTSQEG